MALCVPEAKSVTSIIARRCVHFQAGVLMDCNSNSPPSIITPMRSTCTVLLDAWVSLFLSLLIHVVLVWWFLLHLQTLDDSEAGQNALVMVYWLDDPEREHVPASTPERIVHAPPSRALQVQEIAPVLAHEAAISSAGQMHIDTAQSPATLDLSLPKSMQETTVITERVPWERDSPVEYQSTRFNRSWAPTDKSIQHEWAHRSAVAGLVLGAVGALQEPCTQKQRDRRERHCFGEQYKGDWDTRMDDLER